MSVTPVAAPATAAGAPTAPRRPDRPDRTGLHTPARCMVLHPMFCTVRGCARRTVHQLTLEGTPPRGGQAPTLCVYHQPRPSRPRGCRRPLIQGSGMRTVRCRGGANLCRDCAVPVVDEQLDTTGLPDRPGWVLLHTVRRGRRR